MSLPNDQLSTTPRPTQLLSPDSLQSSTGYDYELGGVGLNDPSQGLQVQTWVAYQVGADIIVADEADNETVVTSPGAVDSLSLAFDQNMQPAIAYEQSGASHLYWFDTTIPGFVTLDFPGVRTPRLCMDEKRALNISQSDIILAYIRDDRLYYRQQRDRFTVEREPDDTYDATGLRLRNVGMGDNNRLHFLLS